MTALLLVWRLLIAATLIAAGSLKLNALAAFRQSLADFRVPNGFQTPLSVALPLAEIGVGLGLVWTGTSLIAAAAGAVLSATFFIVVAATLLAGHRPTCQCFGQAMAHPIGPSTLVTSGALSFGSALVAWHGATFGFPSVAMLGGGLPVALWVAIGLVLCALGGLIWLLFQILAQQGRILLRIEAFEDQMVQTGSRPRSSSAESSAGLTVGQSAPSFAGGGVIGSQDSLASLLALGKPLALIFADPQCGPCNALFPDIAVWRTAHEASLTVAVISAGSPEATRTKLAPLGIKHAVLQKQFEISRLFQVTATPTMVLIARDGTIGSAAAIGPDAVRELMAFVDRNPPPGAVAAGPVSLPEMSLPTVSGEAFELASLRGSDAVIIFWNPSCGFCRAMLEDLHDAIGRARDDQLAIIIVSQGSAAPNLDQNFQCTVLIDNDFSLGRHFGANGTPAAVRLDHEGVASSPAMSGKPAVLALVEQRSALSEAAV